MANKVLIAYGSKYGSTKEIAEKIGEAIKQEGLDVDVLSADKVKDIIGYQGVVVGSAVYMGMWRKEAVKFLKENGAALANTRVWVFSSGPSGKGDPIQLVKGEKLGVNVKKVMEGIKTQDITVFHGNLNPEKMGGMEKFIVKRVGGDTGDFRDWDMITKWAKGIAAEIKK